MSFTCDLRIRMSAETLSCSSDSRFLSMAVRRHTSNNSLKLISHISPLIYQTPDSSRQEKNSLLSLFLALLAIFLMSFVIASSSSCVSNEDRRVWGFEQIKAKANKLKIQIKWSDALFAGTSQTHSVQRSTIKLERKIQETAFGDESSYSGQMWELTGWRSKAFWLRRHFHLFYQCCSWCLQSGNTHTHTHAPLKPIKRGECSHNENKLLNSDCWAPTATQTWEKNSSMKAALSMAISTSSSSWSHVCGIRGAVVVACWTWRVMGILFVFVLRLECQRRHQHFRMCLDS